MLRKKMLSGVVLLILVISQTMAMAMDMSPGEGMPAGEDMPMGKWWRNPQMCKELNLSEAEKAKLDEAFRNSRRKLIKLKSAVESERFELGNLLESKALDEAAVMKQFEKLEHARTDLARERFSFLIEARKVLGNERFQLLKAQHGKLRQHRRSRIMERPAPPGPGPIPGPVE